ncbi:uncharacterized protein [Macrobrachium rosenbergii]|uniref:uncharacterized protein n=1 Tax=Macrobrachium rosenbergii TaxID=79674 RepID=UPI0034D5F5BD
MKKAYLVPAVILVTACSWRSFSDASRDKRYLFVNPNAPILLGFLLNMPVSLAIPTIASGKGRSLSVQNIIYEDAEIPETLYWDPAYEEQLEKLIIYFAHLELYSMGCQERLLCELAAEPQTFSPIAEVFLKELRQQHGPVTRSSDSLMWRYMAAMREGFTSPIGGCGLSYPKCPLPAEKILNMPVLKVWQFLASKLNLNLV